jgi:hypothetical protein
MPRGGFLIGTQNTPFARNADRVRLVAGRGTFSLTVFPARKKKDRIK